jgi:hypothetical protein
MTDVIFHSVELEAKTFDVNDAVSKLYVDSTTTALKDEILGGVGPAYDTLKELSDALAASGGTLSAEILSSIAAERVARESTDLALSAEIFQQGVSTTSQVAAVQSSLDAEVISRQGLEIQLGSTIQAEMALRDVYRTQDQVKFANDLYSERYERLGQINTLHSELAIRDGYRELDNANLAAEVLARETLATETTTQDGLIRNMVYESMAESMNRDQMLIDTKFSNSEFYSGGQGQHLKITEGAYLEIGHLWRICANNVTGSARRLEFQYRPTVVDPYTTAVPFIRPAPVV